MDTAREELISFRVSDLKQYCFCPRIVYYHHCLPDVRPTTFKMEMGIQQGALERSRERRRARCAPTGSGAASASTISTCDQHA